MVYGAPGAAGSYGTQIGDVVYKQHPTKESMLERDNLPAWAMHQCGALSK